MDGRIEPKTFITHSMKYVVLIIKNTLHFILSLLRTWKNSLLQKKEYAIIPDSNLSIQTKTRRWKSISIHRNVRLGLRILPFFILISISNSLFSQAAWNSGTTYQSNNLVTYGGNIYKNRYDWNSSGQPPTTCLVSNNQWCPEYLLHLRPQQ